MLQSLLKQDLPLDEIILIDDGSDQPLALPFTGVRLIRNARSLGYIICRNNLAALAKGEWLVYLDDDVVLDDAQLLSKAMSLVTQDSAVGAIGFLQRDVNGKFLEYQPYRGNQVMQVPVYYGWAHIIRKTAYLKAGPFTSTFGYGWEETEFSLRLLDCGYKVIGDPSLSVIHDAASSTKNLPRRHFLNDRNMLLTIMLRYPARLVPSWLKMALFGCRPDQTSQEPLALYRLRLVWGVICKIPFVFVHRKAVSHQTLSGFCQLQKMTGVLSNEQESR